MKVAVAGDSAGRDLAALLAAYLGEHHVVADLSLSEAGPDEYYADIADRVASAIKDHAYDRGILICGTGIGVCISANKVSGIRAALTHDTYSAGRAALSNNAHIITIGARVVGPELAKAIADAFLKELFDPGSRSAGNVNAIDRLDQKYRASGATVE